MNPLMQYQVHDRVFVNLPSKGYYYTSDIVSSSTNIGVRPMSAKEEMLSNNPDALMSGKAVSKIIEACCSNIKNADELLTIDTEVLLLAIKAATSEETYKISVSCPKCKTEGIIERDINEMIDDITYLEKEYTFELENGLVAYLKPKTNKLHNEIQNKSFKLQKTVQAINQDVDTPEEEKATILKKLLEDIINLNLEIIVLSIDYIETPNEKIIDKEFISEYVDTLEAKVIKKLNTKLEDIDKLGIKRSVHATCNNPDCNHEWEFDQLRYNPSDFFG